MLPNTSKIDWRLARSGTTATWRACVKTAALLRGILTEEVRELGPHGDEEYALFIGAPHETVQRGSMGEAMLGI